MCGRYVLASNSEEIAAHFSARVSDKGLWTWNANYNLAPAIVAPVIARGGTGNRTLVPMRWGLHPHWRKAMPSGRPLFNARAETAASKASFRTPWRRRRALIPAEGWYEWEGLERPKTPYYIYPKTGGLFAFAGLWDQYRVDEGITLLSFTILTTSAVGPIKHMHHRMPVRLQRQSWDGWLDPETPAEQTIANQYGGDDLAFHEVSRAVSNGRASGANLILPVVD